MIWGHPPSPPHPPKQASAGELCSEKGVGGTRNIQQLRNQELRIRIHMFLGIPEPYPEPLVSGMDPDPALDPAIVYC